MDLIFKYVISWAVVSVQMAPCPRDREASELGIRSQTTYAFMHAETVRAFHQKEFFCKDSADAFVKRLQVHTLEGWYYADRDKVADIKVDSLLVEQNGKKLPTKKAGQCKRRNQKLSHRPPA